MQILQKPNDLDLNLKYAQQQGKIGNFKQTISTLERLTMLYPDNVEIKLYLLSVLVQVDSPEKANTIIEDMKLRRDLSAERSLLNFISSIIVLAFSGESTWTKTDNKYNLISTLSG